MIKKITTLVLIIMVGLSQITYAQTIYTIEHNQGVAIKLKGTSTMHDWEMEAYNTSGKAQFVFKPGSDKELSELKSLSFKLEVKDLKSDSEGLNDNAYEALNADKYQEISYTLASATVTPDKAGYLLKSKGALTIAGVTKDILMDVFLVVNADHTISCNGSYKLNMTDYKVDPPSFMWGAMKTGDALTLDFNIVYTE